MPYIGSASKVSEVLNRKRPLSVAMIWALHEGLDIPAEVLLQKPADRQPNSQLDHAQYPFAEMFKRGYFGSFKGTLREAKSTKMNCSRIPVRRFSGARCRRGVLPQLGGSGQQRRAASLASARAAACLRQGFAVVQ